jgi:carbonic anhydrase
VPRFLALCAILCPLLVGCSGDSEDAAPTTEPPAWNHDPGDSDLGPDAWGEIDDSFERCRAGEEQSPVDIAETVPVDLPPLEVDYPASPFVVENTGHVIEAAMPESGAAGTLTIGGDEYRLVQYHFHAPSEHTRDEGQYDAEVHLVHESEEGALAVVGIFLEASEPANELVELVLESAPEDAGEEVEVDQPRGPSELILELDSASTSVPEYDTYSGSLTTPGCTEGVRWIVLRDTLGISPDALVRLHDLIGGFPGYDGYENNNRPTQPLNDREIERSRD